MAEQNEQKSLVRQGLSYVLVGGTSALLELGVSQLCYAFFHLDHTIANPIAAVVAMIYNFTLNRNLTFKSSSNPARSAVLYLLLWAFNLFVTTTVIGFLLNAGVHSAVAKLLTQAMVVCWNFFLFRKVIFV